MATILSIEGNIGSGKSTIINYLKTNYSKNENIIFLPEPVEEWEKIKDDEGNTILTKFYNDQKKYSFAFQMMAYISRLNILRKTIEKNPGKIIISERSLYTDKYVFAQMLYDDKKMESVEYQIYNNWFHSFSDLAPLHKVIYLKTDPNVSFQRIHERNRTGESSIPFDYIQNCHIYHDKMYDLITCSKKIVDCTNDFKENVDYFEKITKDILDFLE
jgi:deoxyadenosine/deoxycytidine kinase